ncbi:UDP-N-acetylmuramoyl-L-alanine--D-glutamate ligase [Candidatus Saccharibacteria bacterium]|nr:UDP-N-acetylmuramoyl-L-alanine--D-glutamate ligase [Candidatus Saccharibacteria bacterium]
MNIAILGYGIEGQSIEDYFKKHGAEEIKVYDDFDPADINAEELQNYDFVFRSPSVSPNKLPKIKNLTTATKYFFENCPAKIIGITGTKGKGTTCSLITAMLKSFDEKVHLVGNIGKSAISVLDKIKENDVIVYEMSSFQLWDLEKSPHISVVLRIEPDHLNVHDDYDDYVNAKANIAAHQSPEDYTIYYKNNSDSIKIAKTSPGTLIPYPAENNKLYKLIKENLNLPGEHNIENAEAAIFAVSSFYSQDLDTFLKSRNNTAKLKQGLQDFKGLPHRIEFIRELNGVKYYDDNYSSALPALDVALKTFENQPTILIAGGINKGTDESEIRERIFSAPNLKKAILIGETKEVLSEKQNPLKYLCAETLESAVDAAHDLAESYADDGEEVVVLMSPGHASFDMFKNFSDRGEKYTKLVKKLK